MLLPYNTKKIINERYIFGTIFNRQEYNEYAPAAEYIRLNMTHVLYNNIEIYKPFKFRRQIRNIKERDETFLTEYQTSLDGARGIIYEKCSFIEKIIEKLSRNIKISRRLLRNYLENFFTLHSNNFDVIIISPSLFFQYNFKNSEFEPNLKINFRFEEPDRILETIIMSLRTYFNSKIYVDFYNLNIFTNKGFSKLPFVYVYNFYKNQIGNAYIDGFSFNLAFKFNDDLITESAMKEIFDSLKADDYGLLFYNILYDDVELGGTYFQREKNISDKYNEFLNAVYNSIEVSNTVHGFIFESITPFFSSVKRSGNTNTACTLLEENLRTSLIHTAFYNFFIKLNDIYVS